MQQGSDSHQAAGIGCKGLQHLSPVRVPSEVIELVSVDDHGQHLPGHHCCCLCGYGSLDVGVEHYCPVNIMPEF